MLGADRTTLWLVDRDNRRLWSKIFNKRVFSTSDSQLEVSMDTGLVGWVARTGRPVNVANAYDDPRFNSQVDATTTFRTTSVLAHPVMMDGRVVAVVQALNKQGGAFDANDEKLLAMLAGHVSVFMSVVCKDMPQGCS